MFKGECPHCRGKLGDFLYADACPHCHEVLKDNLPLADVLHVKAATARSWPVRAFYGIVRFVES
jgi:hypothetical protein